jgi:hypothetical protein
MACELSLSKAELAVSIHVCTCNVHSRFACAFFSSSHQFSPQAVCAWCALTKNCAAWCRCESGSYRHSLASTASTVAHVVADSNVVAQSRGSSAESGRERVATASPSRNAKHRLQKQQQLRQRRPCAATWAACERQGGAHATLLPAPHTLRCPHPQLPTLSPLHLMMGCATAVRKAQPTQSHICRRKTCRDGRPTSANTGHY